MSGLTFNLLLRSAGLDPAHVRLLRHGTDRHGSRTPHALLRRDAAAFERYQSTQKRAQRAYFDSPYWASFVSDAFGQVVFIGLYRVNAVGPVPDGWSHALNDEPLLPEQTDLYQLERLPELDSCRHRLIVDWPGSLAWRQIAENRDKAVLELRRDAVDPPFPGYTAFVGQLQDVDDLPLLWQAALAQAKGVYLLCAPDTHEQYVGSATGNDGFIGRWRSYASDGDGGNVRLRSRDLGAYRVSILQVAGSADDRDAVLAMETLWKRKLQSREMGLNAN